MVAERPFRDVADDRTLLREDLAVARVAVVAVAPQIRQLLTVGEQEDRAGYRPAAVASGQPVIDAELAGLAGAHGRGRHAVDQQPHRLDVQVSPGIPLAEGRA